MSGGRTDTARTRVLVATVVGVVFGLAAFSAGKGAPLIGWDAAALTFCVWTWATVWGLDPTGTREHSQRESPSRGWADVLLLGAALASMIAVGAELFGASHAPGALKYVQAGFAVASVTLSWVLVHTVYALKYARLYYFDAPGGVAFNEDEPPQYTDFAYLAFTLGMTFQVSDTALQSKEFRRTAMRHSWISFPLVAVIIAVSINLVSGLAR